MTSANSLFSNYKGIEDVNILVGRNGCGKSSFLNELGRHHIRNNRQVIAIANTIYDKFSFRGSNAKFLRHSKGKNIAKNSIKNVLKTLATDQTKSLYRIRNVFEYINFEPRIEFKIHNLNPNFREILIESVVFTPQEKEDMLYFLNRSIENLLLENAGIFILNFNDMSELDGLKNLFFIQIIDNESKLKKLKILDGIEIFLIKENNYFTLNNASSGELSIITTLIFISANITTNSIILIDEPENSLHPKWQIDYVKNLLDLFYFFEPKIIIATHSPLIINGSEITKESTKIFKGIQYNQFERQPKDLLNVEEIYEDYFDVTTPENRYVSEAVIEEFNYLAEQKISYRSFTQFINEIISKSYDTKQQNALKGILELATKFA